MTIDLRQSPTKVYIIIYTHKKRGTVCPHLQTEGPRNSPNNIRWSHLSSSTHNA